MYLSIYEPQFIQVHPVHEPRVAPKIGAESPVTRVPILGT